MATKLLPRNNLIACPLDCYDACQAYMDENGKIKASKDGLSAGFLCSKFTSLLKENYLKDAIYQNKNISINEGFDILVKKLKSTDPKKVLYYKGSGNIGKMQNAPQAFFSRFGAVGTRGSLCDGGGSCGIYQSRSKVVNPPLDMLKNADIIVVWGRNISTTSVHMYEQIKNKDFILIDPVAIPIAKKAKLHLKVLSKGDFWLSLMIAKYAKDLGMIKKDLSSYTQNLDQYLKHLDKIDLKECEKYTSISKDEILRFLELIKGKNVAFMLGLGVQKYFEGATIMRSIDSLACLLGLHDKKRKSGGVWYLSNSSHGFKEQFALNWQELKDICEVDFEDYELVFIQGVDPLVSAPNTKRAKKGLQNTFVVYFGTSLNETCKYADLIISSKNFLCKKDVRISYGSRHRSLSFDVKNDPFALSEYELSFKLMEAFGLTGLKSEDEYFKYFAYHDVDYDTDFIFKFLDDFHVNPLDKKQDEYYFLSAKKLKSLNSQFANDDKVYLHSSCGFKDDEMVLISSSHGKEYFQVKIDDNIAKQSAFFYAGNKKANTLTSHKSDKSSHSAMFEEVLLRIMSA